MMLFRQYFSGAAKTGDIAFAPAVFATMLNSRIVQHPSQGGPGQRLLLPEAIV
jgi:hypothetical protein